MVALHPKRVLVPTDFSDQADKAVDEALALTENPDQLTVLHVAPPLSNYTVGDPMIGLNAVSGEERIEHLLDVLHKRYSNKKYEKVHFQVLFGTPAHEIADFAEKEHADLIVIPSHGRTGLARLMIGSVAERVVRLAHCPVLVLRE
jgi:nucleotide-binding universal stress UspA family protein